MSNDLPRKEAQLFKKMLVAYEQRQYVHAQRICKQITSNPKCSANGEVISMNGLIQHSLGNTESGLELAKNGIKNNPRSSICWHIYGIILRNERKYREAVKCYKTAWKLNSGNLQILKDMSLLEIRIRDYPSFQDSTRELLRHKPTMKTSWLSFAVAMTLCGEYSTALEILASLRNSLKPTSNPKDFEYSQVILFEVRVLVLAGRHFEALTHLKDNSCLIFDREEYMEYSVQLSLKLAKESAVESINTLLRRNPENPKYYEWMEQCIEPDGDSLVTLYRTLTQRFPRSVVANYRLLQVASGEYFRQLSEEYFRDAFSRALPSIFKSVKGLYSDVTKMMIIEQTVLQLKDEMKLPHAFLMCLLYLAQHYDFKGDVASALEYIDMSITHTPTHLDAFVIKARILCNAGDMSGAVECAKYAQSADTADRHLNCVCVKYMLMAGRIEEAVELAARFTKSGVSVDESLNEMQCLWYLGLSAKAYWKRGDVANTLQKCSQIMTHLDEMDENEYDFHMYCIRKQTLSTYLDFLPFQDNLYSNKHFVTACHLVCKIYFSTYDDPKCPLVKEADPLSCVEKYLGKLKRSISRDVRVPLMFFELYKRRGKPLLMIKALRMAADLSNPHVHLAVVELFQYCQRPLSEYVKSLCEEYFRDVGVGDVREYNEAFMRCHSHSIAHSIIGFRVMSLLGESVSLDMFCESVNNGVFRDNPIEDYLFVLDELRKHFVGYVDAFVVSARVVFPWCEEFGVVSGVRESELMPAYYDVNIKNLVIS